MHDIVIIIHYLILLLLFFFSAKNVDVYEQTVFVLYEKTLAEPKF